MMQLNFVAHDELCISVYVLFNIWYVTIVLGEFDKVYKVSVKIQ